MVTLENRYLKIEIADHGAEIVSIFEKESGEQRLWNADARFWKRSSPVLFPNVGKVYGGVMRTPLGEFPLSQHGFARDMDFTCVSSDENSAVYELHANEESLKRYPYSFLLRISYTLNGREIDVKWNVRNDGTDVMAFTIGGHPAFVFPQSAPKKEQHSVYIPGANVLKYRLLDLSCGCAADGEAELATDGGYIQLSEEMFEHDALIFDGGQIREAWVCDEQKNRMIGIRAEKFPNFGIWSVKDAPFVCLEPWQGRTDDAGFTGMYAEKKGVVSLSAGEGFTTSYQIMTDGE